MEETKTRLTTWWSMGHGEDHCRMSESKEELMLAVTTHHLVTATVKVKPRKNELGKARHSSLTYKNWKNLNQRVPSVFNWRTSFEHWKMLKATQRSARATSTLWESRSYTHQRSLPGIPTEGNEGVDYGGCLQAIESRGALKYKVTDTRSKRLKDRYGQQYRETDRTVKRTLRATSGAIWNT